jgi:hypothetical protein
MQANPFENQLSLELYAIYVIKLHEHWLQTTQNKKVIVNSQSNERDCKIEPIEPRTTILSVDRLEIPLGFKDCVSLFNEIAENTKYYDELPDNEQHANWGGPHFLDQNRAQLRWSLLG